ncbi:hypothetical protein ACOSQ3_027948 [Xanthoceras sorbifolium]
MTDAREEVARLSFEGCCEINYKFVKIAFMVLTKAIYTMHVSSLRFNVKCPFSHASLNLCIAVASDSVSVPGGVGTAPVEVDLGVSGKKKGDDSVVTDSVPVPNSTVLAPLVSAVSEVSEISVADSSVPIDQCAHMDFTPVLSADLVADLPVSDPKTVAADIIKEA